MVWTLATCHSSPCCRPRLWPSLSALQWLRTCPWYTQTTVLRWHHVAVHCGSLELSCARSIAHAGELPPWVTYIVSYISPENCVKNLLLQTVPQSVKQKEAQSARAESTNKGVNLHLKICNTKWFQILSSYLLLLGMRLPADSTVCCTPIACDPAHFDFSVHSGCSGWRRIWFLDHWSDPRHSHHHHHHPDYLLCHLSSQDVGRRLSG